MVYLLAIDPGTRKFGWAVLDPQGGTTARGIGDRGELDHLIRRLARTMEFKHLVLGDGTGSEPMLCTLRGLSDAYGFRVHRVDETLSTLEARAAYFQKHPPRGLRRLIPRSLQVPPEPYDDLVAVILGRRFLAGKKGEGV